MKNNLLIVGVTSGIMIACLKSFLKKEYKIFATYSNEKRIKCSIIVNGKYNGLQKEWYEDGQLKSERLMKDGEIVGKQISYYENGKIKTIVVDGVPIH